MILGPYCRKPFCTITSIFLVLSCLFPSTQRVAFWGFFLLLSNCSFGACSISVSNYSRRYNLKFLLILGMSLKKSTVMCMFVYEIPALLKCIWNVLRIFLRTRDNFFSSHQNLIAFDLPPFLTKWKHTHTVAFWFQIHSQQTLQNGWFAVLKILACRVSAVWNWIREKMDKAGDSLGVAAFLLFLKIVIKMWYPSLYCIADSVLRYFLG